MLLLNILKINLSTFEILNKENYHLVAKPYYDTDISAIRLFMCYICSFNAVYL